MFGIARSVIGGEAITVSGGSEVSAVLAEVDQSREFESGGFDRDQTLDAVVSVADWIAAYPLADSSYLGKTATARGLTFRVGAIRKGQSFVTIRLNSPRKGA